MARFNSLGPIATFHAHVLIVRNDDSDFCRGETLLLERGIFSLALSTSIILTYSLQLFLLAAAFPTTEIG